MDVRPLLKWKENGVERPAWSEISDEPPTFKVLWAQWDSLRLENGLPKRAWKSPDGKHTTMQLVLLATRIREVLRDIHNGGSCVYFVMNKTISKFRDSTGSIVEKMWRTGARDVRSVRRSRDQGLEREGRCNNTTSVNAD